MTTHDERIDYAQGFAICGPNSGCCGVEGSRVWVHQREPDGRVNPDNNVISFHSGQEWADACHNFVGREWAICDTRGEWFEVVERAYIGWETVGINPPGWTDEEEGDF